MSSTGVVMQSGDDSHLSWPFPDPDGEIVRQRLSAVSNYIAHFIDRQALPYELLTVITAALKQPQKLLASPAVTSGMPLQRSDGAIWALHVLLMHAATAHCDSICAPDDWALAVPIAAAAELLGTALDIFDDVQDQDGDLIIIYGVPMMINGAMALCELGRLALADTRLPLPLRAFLHQALASDTLRAVGGQTLDVAFEQRTQVTLDDAVDMTERKSGSLVGLTYRLGALAGLYGHYPDDAMQEMSDHFAAFGRNLGVILQLENDWNDAWESEQRHKSDRERNKKTLPLVVEKVKAPSSLPSEERRSFVLRVVQTAIGLHRQRARSQLEALIASYHLSPRWLQWLVAG